LQATDRSDKQRLRGKDDRKYWHCDRKGHIKVNCFGWLRDTEEGRKYAAEHPKARTGPLPTPGAKGNLSPKEKAQVADEFTGEACWEASESVRNRQEWQVDLGATSHMTPDRTAFIEYAMLSTRQSVVAANGSTLPGIGRGRVRIPVSVDGHTRSIVLTDVLHVPQIKGNLISVARLQDKGLVVETTAPPKRMALVIKDHGRKVGVASRVGRSYILDMPTESAMPAGLATDRQEGVTDSQGEVTDHQEEVTDRQASVYARWHQRFGHLGPQLIEKVHKVVGDMPQHVRPTEGQPTCEVCALTKKVRVINRASPERSIEPLARVFSDFWGPYREPALTGDVYMLTFTDDYTRKSWVTLTKLRSVLPSVYAC
jgi:5'-3' exoribonuclease 2